MNICYYHQDLLLHAVHMYSSYECIIVRSDDTDGLVLLLYYASKEKLGSSVYMHAGHISQFRDQRRYIAICTIVNKVGKDICQNLPAALTLQDQIQLVPSSRLGNEQLIVGRSGQD